MAYSAVWSPVARNGAEHTMEDTMPFSYCMPTRVIAGPGCLVEQGEALKSLGTKALIVTGARSARASGALDDAVRALTDCGLPYAVYDKVMSNPTVQCAYDGADMARANGCDFMLAIGGGSPLDAAKAMALLAASDAPPDPEAVFGASFTKALPVAAVPTTAGTGSEVTQYAILANDAAETKTSIATPLIFPRLAFLDGAYMRGLGRGVTVNTAIDALSHAVEGMLSVRASVISDTLARQSLAMIAPRLEAAGAGALDAGDRDELLLASTLAGMVIANTGTTAVHAMGYSLTYYKNVDHGRANGLLLPQFLMFVERSEPGRVADILACMGLASTAAFAALMASLLGKRERLSPEEYTLYADKASKAANIANSIVRPERDDLLGMLRAALG